MGLAAPQVGVNVRLMVFNPEGNRGQVRVHRPDSMTRRTQALLMQALPSALLTQGAAGSSGCLQCGFPGFPLQGGSNLQGGSLFKNQGEELVLANPRIISSSRNQELGEEGCLSFLKLNSDQLIRADVEVPF